MKQYKLIKANYTDDLEIKVNTTELKALTPEEEKRRAKRLEEIVGWLDAYRLNLVSYDREHVAQLQKERIALLSPPLPKQVLPTGNAESNMRLYLQPMVREVNDK